MHKTAGVSRYFISSRSSLPSNCGGNWLSCAVRFLELNTLICNYRLVVIENIVRISTLKRLRLFGCVNVTDEAILHLAALPSLEDLSLSACAITGEGLNLFT